MSPAASSQSYIAERVATGRRGPKREVLREGVRLVQDREALLVALLRAT
ncbi:type II toxin-antitoxin system ParD family antitoxin [Pandoraea horticolens]|nr:type II toxin-antitoxin system ParD family antitoxin [Pandoraea horticolens]